MTPLTKPVHRLTQTMVRDRGSKSRLIVAGLLPGDVLEFRMQGTRKRFVLPIATAYYQAARLEAARVVAQRQAARRARRA